MRGISNRALKALRGSHSVQIRAWVVEPGQTGVAPTGIELEVVGGNVVMDAMADIRSTIDIEVIGRFPTRTTDLLAPYGNEVFVRYGIQLGNGGFEWVSLGYFRINSVEQDDPKGPIRLAGQDRMGGIVKARLAYPVQFVPEDTYGEAFERLVLEVYPSAVIEWDDDQDLQELNVSMVAEQDRFTFLKELANGAGFDMYFDYRGVLVIKRVPASAEAVWEVNAGRNGVLVSLGREISDEGVFNAVVAIGESVNDRPPLRALAYDNDPYSPTYYFGEFGKVTKFITGQYVDQQAAQFAAIHELQHRNGAPYIIDFQSIVNPALEPLDTIGITYQDRREVHVISRLTVPLNVESPMQAETRESLTLIIGDSDA